jgi:hypothetical protein
MAANLKENGTLIIDYLNVGLIEDTNGNDTMLQMDHLIFHTKKWQDDLYLFKEIKVVDATSHEVMGIFEERVRKYNLQDFTVFMQKAGLQIMATFGDYQLNVFEPERSDRLILVAQKHSIS